eukprot:TRINITY_DN501_c0_g1_i3.p1 TRINITY_DN501_c0_g1~~TRINITY_DN501_c0_g1_i3.p1  ORF type:complete len:130 (+),score=46.29 TRINITY_DN501_c0_g1_i3:166-555(+)
MNLRSDELKRENEKILSDLHEEIQLVNTRVSNTVNVLEAYTKQISSLRGEIDVKLNASDGKMKTMSDQAIAPLREELQKMAGNKDKPNLAVEVQKGIEHMKESMDGIWSSIGVLSGRITEIEAHNDRRR